MNETQNAQNNQNPFSLTHAFQNALGCAQGLGNTPGTGGGRSAGPISDSGFLGPLLNRDAPLPRTTRAEYPEAGVAGTASPPAARRSAHNENARQAMDNWRELVSCDLKAELGKLENESLDRRTLLMTLERGASAAGRMMHSQTQAAEDAAYLFEESDDWEWRTGNGQEGPLSPLATLNSMINLNELLITLEARQDKRPEETLFRLGSILKKRGTRQRKHKGKYQAGKS